MGILLFVSFCSGQFTTTGPSLSFANSSFSASASHALTSSGVLSVPLLRRTLCAFGSNNRAAAIAKMEGALRGMVVKGIRTTIPFHLRLLGNAHFRHGRVDTHFLERRMSGAEEDRL